MEISCDSYKVQKKTSTAGYEIQCKAVSPKPEEDKRNMQVKLNQIKMEQQIRKLPFSQETTFYCSKYASLVNLQHTVSLVIILSLFSVKLTSGLLFLEKVTQDLKGSQKSNKTEKGIGRFTDTSKKRQIEAFSPSFYFQNCE